MIAVVIGLCSMNEGIRQVLQRYEPWLRSLRWVSPAERVLAWICVAGVIALAVLACAHGNPLAAVYTAGGHILLLAAVCLLVPRRTCAIWLAFLLLSMVNYVVALLRGFPGLELITYAYGVIGIIALLVTAIAWRRLNVRWQGIAQYETRDDFRWLLTKAPLIPRGWLALSLTRFQLHPAGDETGGTSPRVD